MMMGNNQYAQTYAKMKSGKQKNQGVIFIEDINDKAFWEKIATQHVVQLYSEQGKTITGKSSLLKICNSNQLIAIDSDFDVICPNHRAESALHCKNNAFILQTHANGLENLVLSPEYLHDVLNRYFQFYENIEIHGNHIQEIIQRLSEIWFEPYRKFLFLKDNGFSQFTHKHWIKHITFKGKESQEIALKLNFEKYEQRLLELNNHLNQYITNEQNYQEFCEHLAKQGFSKQRVYGFIQCHNWKDKFVFPIIEMIYSQRIKTEMRSIGNYFQGKELSNRRGQINKHFKENCGIQTILHNHFYQSYFSSARAENFFIQKIVQDYERIIGNA